MANHYRSVLESGGTQPTGDAVAADVLTGKTFSNASAVGIAGTMPNRGAVSGQATPSQPYTIPEGYHNGSGVVTATSAYNPTTMASVATDTGFTAVVGKHYAVALDVGSSSATNVTFTGMTADALVAGLTPAGRRMFFYVGTATATTVTASFVGTVEAGTMYPCQID